MSIRTPPWVQSSYFIRKTWQGKISFFSARNKLSFVPDCGWQCSKEQSQTFFLQFLMLHKSVLIRVSKQRKKCRNVLNTVHTKRNLNYVRFFSLLLYLLDTVKVELVLSEKCMYKRLPLYKKGLGYLNTYTPLTYLTAAFDLLASSMFHIFSLGRNLRKYLRKCKVSNLHNVPKIVSLVSACPISCARPIAHAFTCHYSHPSCLF